MMACDEYEDSPGVFFAHLHVSPKVRCWEEPHKTWFATAAFFLCIYTFGIPAAALSILLYNRQHLDGTAADSAFFLQTFGFLSAGFRFKHWEVTVVMMRKVFFVFIITMLASTTTLIQTHCAILFIAVCISLHFWFKPYKDSTLNLLEALSLSTTFMTLYGGVIYYIDRNGRRIAGLQTAVVITLIVWHAITALVMVLTGVRLWIRLRAESSAEKRSKEKLDSTSVSTSTDPLYAY